MTDRNYHKRKGNARRNWEGMTELDRALAENRLTEYRIKKAWVDPLVRLFGLGVGVLFAAYICFVIYWDIIRH